MENPQSPASGIRRLVVSEILVVLVLGLSYVGFKLLYAQKPEVDQKDIDPVQLNVDVFEVQPVTFHELLTGFGTARADREVIVAAQTTGEIVEIHSQLKAGYSVKATGVKDAGNAPSYEPEMLLKMDPRDHQERVEQSESRIEESKTEIAGLRVQQESTSRQLAKSRSILATLQEEFERLKRGLERNVTTPSDVNRASLEVQRYEDAIIQLENQAASIPHQIKAAEQRLTSAESERNRALTDLQRTIVTAPFDGVLSEVYVEQGRFVRAGEQLLKVVDPSLVEIPVSLGLEDFLHLQQQLKAGQHPEVTLSPDETSETTWNGHVVRAAPEADTQSRTVQIFVEVSNLDSDIPLLPGTFTHASIVGGRFTDALLVPRDAVVRGHVFVVDKAGTAHRRTVIPGRRFQSMILIESGLKPGDQLVLTNLDVVEDGQDVLVQNTVNAAIEIASLRTSVVRLITDAEPGQL